jgi:hypothetical protein
MALLVYAPLAIIALFLIFAGIMLVGVVLTLAIFFIPLGVVGYGIWYWVHAMPERRAQHIASWRKTSFREKFWTVTSVLGMLAVPVGLYLSATG